VSKLGTMEVKFAVLADYANVTREGKLNLLGIFDVINTSKFPVILPTFYVVVSYAAGAAEFGSDKDVEIVVCDEDGNHLFRAKQVLHITRPDRSGALFMTNQIAGIVGFPFKKSGDYQFSILVNGEEKKTLSLRVNEVKPKQQGVE
jgi:hypothetical protein